MAVDGMCYIVKTCSALRKVSECNFMAFVYKILVGKPEGPRSRGKLGLDGRIILKWILR
jgi:hypothetical protein